MRRNFLALAGVAALTLGAADYQSKAFPDWSADTVMRVLVDSPWSRVRKVKLTWYGRRGEAESITYRDIPGTRPGIPASSTAQGGSPVGGIGAGKVKNKLPDQADLIFRWASALPVRQAKALYRARDQQRGATDATAMVETRPASGGPLLEIYGLPSVAAHAGTEALSALIKQTTVLRSKKTGAVRRPVSVETSVSGEFLTVSIQFAGPPDDPLSVAADQEVICTGRAGELFEFEERFKLRDMVYLGSLEI